MRTLSLSVLALASVLLFSCENGRKEEGGVQAPQTISLSTETLSVELAGGSFPLTVTAPSKPKVSAKPDWVTVQDGTYNPETYKVTLTLKVEAYGLYGSREGEVTVSAGSLSKTLKITQQGREKPEMVDVDIDTELVTQGANTEVQALYDYLLSQYGKKTISSVTADVAWNTKIAQKVFRNTGKYPAVNCYDFIHICVPEGNGWIDYNDLTPVTEWADAGGIVSLMWHFNVPLSAATEVKTDGSGVAFYSGKSTFKASNALVEGTWENVWYKDQVGKVADIILRLQEKGIVAIWRPYHEAAGNYHALKWKGTAWFWWGDEGPEVFKALWNDMFDFFYAKGIRNLIWVWTAQSFNGDPSSFDSDESWYPGDDKVDVVARDIYGSTAIMVTEEFVTLQNTYPHKMIALGECGHGEGNAAFPSLVETWNMGAKWSWFMPWGSSDGTMAGWDWMKEAMSGDFVITRDNINL